MKNVIGSLVLVALCLCVVWFASSNGETLDNWFAENGRQEISFKENITSVPEGSHYIIAKSNKTGTTEKLTSGPIPEAGPDDMFVHKGYTYVYIVPTNPTAIRYGLAGNRWYIYASPTTGEKPIQQIRGVDVVQKTLKESMAEDQEHVIGDEHKGQN